VCCWNYRCRIRSFQSVCCLRRHCCFCYRDWWHFRRNNSNRTPIFHVNNVVRDNRTGCCRDHQFVLEQCEDAFGVCRPPCSLHSGSRDPVWIYGHIQTT
jgi:hypothetical protein